jgi:hypothetical protein
MRGISASVLMVKQYQLKCIIYSSGFPYGFPLMLVISKFQKLISKNYEHKKLNHYILVREEVVYSYHKSIKC